jgi:hypothetical protein
MCSLGIEFHEMASKSIVSRIGLGYQQDWHGAILTIE